MKQTLLLLLAIICLNAKAVTAVPVITMTTAKSEGDYIFLTLAANADNTVVQVDFGDGILVDKTIGIIETQISGPIIGSQVVKIYGSGINFLKCSNQMLTSIDVTKNTALTVLDCSGNQLTTLDLTKNTALTELSCNYNQLTSLDLTNNAALTNLYCRCNQLTDLNVTQNRTLTNLYCYVNQLTSLDVTNNTALTSLICYSNLLSSLDVTNNTALTVLNCSTNQITSLDVTNNTALKNLFCTTNLLTSLDVTNNTALKWLHCSGNQLTTLDVTKDIAITELYCKSNQLTFATLPLSKPTTFTYAPQNAINIANSFTTSSPIDLSSQLTVNGNTTNYTWKTESGTTLTAGTDYTIDGGKTTFKTIPAEKVYCEMTNATFPDLSGTNVLKTTLTTIVMATAVEDAKAGTVDIYTRNQTVYLSLPESAEVQVYDITGHQIKADYYNSGNNNFEVAQKGIYIIKVNMHDQVVSKKIVIR